MKGIIAMVIMAVMIAGCDDIVFGANQMAGIASFYTEGADTFNTHTASGEVFDEDAMTCAMPHRDFGRFYKVTNLANGKSVVVRHNDLGPSRKMQAQGRIIDLSRGAFAKIADLRLGLIKVKVQVVTNIKQGGDKKWRPDMR
jgi:rare lipoprotein A